MALDLEFSKSLILLNAVLFGISVIPIVPVLINFSSEITFPQEPTVITGLMLMMGRVFGFFLTLFMAYVSDI